MHVDRFTLAGEEFPDPSPHEDTLKIPFLSCATWRGQEPNQNVSYRQAADRVSTYMQEASFDNNNDVMHYFRKLGARTLHQSGVTYEVTNNSPHNWASFDGCLCYLVHHMSHVAPFCPLCYSTHLQVQGVHVQLIMRMVLL